MNKIQIFLKKTKPKKGLPKGAWLCYTPWSYAQSFGNDKKDAVEQFIEIHHMKMVHVEVVEK